METSSIEEKIVAYLRLEFGENGDDFWAIGISDLAYVGEVEAGGEVTRYWSFPCSEPRWATVRFAGRQRIFGMATELPAELSGAKSS